MKHIMNLNPSPFEMIRSGKKTIELRLNDEKRRLINRNDEIEFINTENVNQTLICKIVNTYCFDSFEKLYKELPLLKCGYTETNIDSAKPCDMDAYYSKEKQNEYGVIGIEVDFERFIEK